MLPLIGIAVSLVPELIRLISAGKTNASAADVSHVVTDTLGIQDETRARARLADSAIPAQLQTRLTEIALDAYKLQVEAYSEQRQTHLDKLGAFLADTQGARSLTTTLADKGSPIGWGAPVIFRHHRGRLPHGIRHDIFWWDLPRITRGRALDGLFSSKCDLRHNPNRLIEPCCQA
jgi:hypothetical protein